ncbi:MAG: EAL domain-containing protein, partial [Erysipelotrichaceae bacterium]
LDYLKYYLEENLKKDKSIKALILVNCINFKRINMSYGYIEGDFVLQKMAEKLNQLSSKYCKIFKFNADRFIVLIENVDDLKAVQSYALDIEKMFSSSEFKPDLDVNMGIVEIEKVEQDVDDILRDVSIALSNVDINQTYAIFDTKMEQTLHREDVIEDELKEALRTRDHNRLYFQYQPIFSLNDRLINEACILIQKLEELGFSHIKIAVNISGIQVMQDEFVYSVERIIKKHSIDPSQLELEITESVYMQDFNSINQKLFRLKELGVSISMDDFGTGFSSFYRLKETYLDVLKIDRTFIKNIDSNLDDKHISKDIISIAHKYNLKCVAEGIENVYQLDMLKKHGCDYGQGYYLAYPMDEDDLFDKLKQTKRVQ